MRREEAIWIADALRRHGALVQAGVAVNLGSGDTEALLRGKPWIEEQLFAPLRLSGMSLVHSDLVPHPAVSLVGDLLSTEFQSCLAALEPRLVFLCNVLEHLPRETRRLLPDILKKTLPAGTYLAVSVPYSYPYHADPIDTLYRPTPHELEADFREGFRALDWDTVLSETYGDELRALPFRSRMRKLLYATVPLVRPRRWLSHAHRLGWLWRPYQVSCILLQRREEARTGDADLRLAREILRQTASKAER